jgi:hypothetical protein
MHLAQHRRAQAMRGKPPAALDGDFRAHALSVAWAGNFGKIDEGLARKLLE